MGADQPTAALLQGHLRPRQRDLGEPPTPSFLTELLDYRVVWRRERYLIDHHEREGVAGNVHTLPEGARPDEHRAARRLEPGDQPTRAFIALELHRVRVDEIGDLLPEALER